MDYRQKVIGAVIAVGLILIAIFWNGFYKSTTNSQQNSITTQNQNEDVRLISTTPSNLNELTVIPTQVIEFEFNAPLENKDEVRMSFEPEADIKIELSDDRKIMRVIPNKPYSLGQGYSIQIKSDTKFEGKRTLGEDYTYHFKTISYSGV